MKTHPGPGRRSASVALAAVLLFGQAVRAASDADSAQAEHADIGVSDQAMRATAHTQNPGAQWYPEAGLGLFIHWGISSVRAMNISWPMIPGRALARRHIDDPAELARIIREGDYNLNGRPNEITPNEYWSLASAFNPRAYDPDDWMKAAKAAGFRYVVLTTRHHEGFALWPSKYGDFDTKNFMGGRDLLKPYVAACRKYGLKVGFYYSPPDWYFDRDYKNFLYGGAAKRNPELPALGPDLKPRTSTHTAEEIAAHRAAYAALVRGQVEELLTRYGKIDLLWFDGKPEIGPGAKDCISEAEVRRLQPAIVVNPRLWDHGDFVTYERTLPAKRPDAGWAEFCNPWTSAWPYVEDPRTHRSIPFRAPGYVLGQLARCRAWGINYLLGIGPMADGRMCPEVYQNMAIVGGWMKANGASVQGTRPLPEGETASVPATSRGGARYLFAVPEFRRGGSYPEDQLPPKDCVLTLSGVARPQSVELLGSGRPLEHSYANGTVSVRLPAALRTNLVDVVRVDLTAVD